MNSRTWSGCRRAVAVPERVILRRDAESADGESRVSAISAPLREIDAGARTGPRWQFCTSAPILTCDLDQRKAPTMDNRSICFLQFGVRRLDAALRFAFGSPPCGFSKGSSAAAPCVGTPPRRFAKAYVGAKGQRQKWRRVAVVQGILLVICAASYVNAAEPLTKGQVVLDADFENPADDAAWIGSKTFAPRLAKRPGGDPGKPPGRGGAWRDGPPVAGGRVAARLHGAGVGDGQGRGRECQAEPVERHQVHVGHRDAGPEALAAGSARHGHVRLEAGGVYGEDPRRRHGRASGAGAGAGHGQGRVRQPEESPWPSRR